MSDFTLKVNNGRVNYIEHTDPSPPSFGVTKLDAARWLIEQNPPFRSYEHDGYPIAVKTERGSMYYFEGTWPEKRKRTKKTRG